MFSRPSLPATGFGALITGVESSDPQSSAGCWAHAPGTRIVLTKVAAKPAIPRRTRTLGVRVMDVMGGLLMHRVVLAASPTSL
jgi:hypothetical protein